VGDGSTAYWVAWSKIPGVGAARARKLEAFFGNLAEAWGADAFALKSAGIDERVIGAFLRERRKLDPEAEMERLRGARIEAHALPDASYPARLREAPNPPMVLYARGGLTPEDEWAVGIVGTRRASQYGRRVAADLAGELGRSRVTVVSGLARGIDGVAHKAALDAGGRSIAVLGSGVDQVYPWENRGLAERMVEGCGAVVSEYPPGTKPDARNFPPRNRIITGLSLGLIVVEADMKSGALISAGFADEQGRKLMAVPGPVTSSLSDGPHYLLKLGAAKMVTSAQDVLEELNLQQVAAMQETRQAVPADPTEAVLLGRLSAEPVHVDELARETGLAVALVSGTLTLMELKGLARSVGVMQYVAAR
jgi:DNA processing protein